MIAPQTKGHVEALLRARGRKPHRRWGQNFLVDPNMMRCVVREADPGPQDVVLEIGPGTGSLTALLAARARAVIAVEIDADLVAICREQLAGCANVQLLHRDVLRSKSRLDDEVLRALADAAPAGGAARLKVVSNLPYNAATPVILCLLTGSTAIETMLLTVQKEIGDRLTAPPGHSDYGLLSLVARRFATVEVLRKLPANVFWPRPKVDSALVRITPVRAFGDAPELNADLLRLAKGIFTQRRKKVANAMAYLDRCLGIGKAGVRAVLDEAAIPPTRRADELSPEDVERLALAVQRLKKGKQEEDA